MISPQIIDSQFAYVSCIKYNEPRALKCESPRTQNSNSQHPHPRINVASVSMPEWAYQRSEIF